MRTKVKFSVIQDRLPKNPVDNYGEFFFKVADNVFNDYETMWPNLVLDTVDDIDFDVDDEGNNSIAFTIFPHSDDYNLDHYEPVTDELLWDEFEDVFGVNPAAFIKADVQ